MKTKLKKLLANLNKRLPLIIAVSGVAMLFVSIVAISFVVSIYLGLVSLGFLMLLIAAFIAMLRD